jgi:putative addiction module component (TIGR02574 family)
VEHTAIPEPPGFSDLSKEEQIRYVQALWDRIFEEPDNLPVPESHLALAEERLSDYRRDPSQARPAFEVLDEIAERLRRR